MIKEAAYKGNLGVMEYFQLIQKANKKEVKEIEKAVKEEDWETYKKLVKKILGINLK